MVNLKKWQLVKSEDVSPSKWFPLEKRTYRLPNGKIVKDFYITTLADSVHIVPVLKTGQVAMIRMYKQGVDDFIIQFPAGRFEPDKHQDKKDTAVAELEEETGIKVDKKDLISVAQLSLASTKATEKEHVFLVKDVSFNSQPNLDDNEEIETLILKPEQIDDYIQSGQIYCAPTIAIWSLVRKKL
jgi:ADP-ribose pyrophosphatase